MSYHPSKGFLATLISTDFSEFITLRWMKGIYTVLLFFAALPLIGGALFALSLFHSNGILGLFGGLFLLVVMAGVSLVQIIFARLSMEFAVVFFRIEEHTRAMANATTPQIRP